VVCGSRDGLVHCVARTDGRLLWTFAAQGDVDSSPVICGDKVIAASSTGRLYVLHMEDGSLLWKYEIGAPIVSSPAVANGAIVIGADDGCVYAFGVSAVPSKPVPAKTAP
jgi:outer membrane protein assembly factor BamB